MQRIIYVTGRCYQCGHYSSRLVNATIDEKQLAPVRCDCGGQVEFSEMAVCHHISDEDNGKAGSKRRRLLDIPSESVAEINTLVIACLCMEAASLLDRYGQGLTATQGLLCGAVAVTLLLSYWLLGRAWFRRSREREESELREKFQREGKFLRDMENRSKTGGRE